MFNRVLHIVIFHAALFYSTAVFGYSSSENNTSRSLEDTSSVKFKTTYQSNNNLNFNDFRSGINSVYVITPDELSAKLFNDSLFLSKYRRLLNDYLHGIGIENVAISSKEHERLDSLVSTTQTAVFQLKLDYTGNYISQLVVSFLSCNKDEFRFEKNINYYIDSNWDEKLFRDIKSLYWQVVPFDGKKSYKLNSSFTGWKEKNIIDYVENNSTDKIEGIYEKYSSDTQFKIGIVKDKGVYDIVYISGAKNRFDWKEGDLKGVIRKTALKDFYKVDWVLADKSKMSEVYLSTAEESFLKFDFIDQKVNNSSKYIKMYPSFTQGKSLTPSAFASSGTGFAVSKEGLIATSYHVIENSNSIVVQFNDKDVSHTYAAEVLISDKSNDLAILKIKDSNFKPFDDVPYVVSQEESAIGTDVFTLGFPLIETMGKSVKLNNGIVSSLSGFLDDAKFYQLTMPINSGNSGGPLFDKTGNLIGIITGKHSGAENVTYALKSGLLSKLLGKIPVLQNHPSGGSLSNEPFTELIKSVKKYICVVEVK